MKLKETITIFVVEHKGEEYRFTLPQAIEALREILSPAQLKRAEKDHPTLFDTP